MTRAEIIMAQVDLDPIESYGSQELSRKQKDSTGKTSIPAIPPTRYNLMDLSEASMREFVL
jgi:hypothetical protein